MEWLLLHAVNPQQKNSLFVANKNQRRGRNLKYKRVLDVERDEVEERRNVKGFQS
jgi:hypothetical protein